MADCTYSALRPKAAARHPARCPRATSEPPHQISVYSEICSASSTSIPRYVGHDRTRLAKMAKLAKQAIGSDRLDVVADRGYFRGEGIKACDEAAITSYLPKPQTSGSAAKGLFGKRDFIYVAEDDAYRCPAGERLTRRTKTQDGNLTV